MIRRLVSAACAAIALTVLSALPAAAHVRVSSDDATQGGYGLLTFRVPTESDTASTTGLIITLPADTPITSVSTQPVPGWTAHPIVKKLPQPVQSDHGEITSYVASIRWQADSKRDGIAPGEFQLFAISAGPLPESDSLVFPTEQRYSDGSSVAWDEIATGSTEPEHPAPTLTLQPAAAASAPASAQPTSDDRAATGDTTTASTVLVAVAVGLAVIAVIMATIALLRTRRD